MWLFLCYCFELHPYKNNIYCNGVLHFCQTFQPRTSKPRSKLSHFQQMCLPSFQGIREPTLHTLSFATSVCRHWRKDRRVFVGCFALPQTAFVMDVIVQGMETIRGYACLTLVPLNGFTFLLRCKKPVFCGTAAYAFTSRWNGSNGEWCSTFLFPFMCSCVSEKCNVFCKDGREESWCQWKRVTSYISACDGESGLKMGGNTQILTAWPWGQ